MVRRVLLAAALLSATALPSAAQSISLSIRDGRVTLVTQNATPAAILAEWARQGQTRVVDGEKVPGTPLTLRLENVSEREALDIVLRGAAGYIAAPRAEAAAVNQSRFDRIVVMATSPGAAAARTAAPMTRAAAPAPPPPPPVSEEPVFTETAPAAGGVAPAIEEAPMAAGAEQPVSSTNFDYANPQRYFSARQAEQGAAEAAPAGQTQTPTTSSSPFGGATRSSPGMLPMPQNGTQPGGQSGTAAVNPYGLPADQSPGSATGTPPMEPDRTKYMNPYAPTPPRP